ncbi:LysR family transcriptional regulator [Streptomyces litchfieldiae]|uniref:LysR family transcriptional regulator n=1 Tax=Streptomyces litchfieldiae TaxID=3075543 RepID=A0ABU2MSJ4_9ACTN|nr:LysR family transcriptional regulator [Streptomyces sp. DSM 44938]MDT0344431.1 LysR family transcriptional regulator [Streptomyces sp. DSM 44938]
MVELRHLRYFLAVAEESSVTAAARRFHMAQPALSQAITRLERQLGASLFDRGGGRLRLTAAGRLLVPEARALLDRADEIAELVPLVRGPERTVLWIGSIASAVSGLLPRVLPDFLAARPEVVPLVYEMGQRRQVDALRAGDIDVGVCRLPRAEPDAGVAVLRLGDEPLRCAVPEGHPLVAAAGGGPLSLRALADEDLVGFPRSLAPVAYDTIVAVCKRAGFSPRFRQEARSDQAILGLVACGLGLALVPEMTTRVRVRNVVYLPVGEPYAVTPLSVAVSAGSPPEAALSLRDALSAARPAGPAESP